MKIFSAAILLATYFIMSTQSIADEPSPPSDKATTISLDSPQGMRLLKESETSGDFFKLLRFFNSQENMAYCGVASSVMILNSLPVEKPTGEPFGAYPFFTQENFFTPKNVSIKLASEVSKSGMSLSQLTGFLNSHTGVSAAKEYASESELSVFRSKVVNALSADDMRVLVNYPRGVLGQVGGGHISPLGAYNKQSDSFLIMDVSQYKYPPVWVSAQLLWSAMSESAGEDGVSRGFVIISPAPETPRIRGSDEAE